MVLDSVEVEERDERLVLILEEILGKRSRRRD